MPYKTSILTLEEIVEDLEADNAHLRQELAEARAENEWLVGGVGKMALGLKEAHQETWRDKPEDHWLAGLREEVDELESSLIGEHEDSPEWELSQIAAICLNWLEMRAEREQEDETP